MAETINTAVYKVRLDVSTLEIDLKKADQMVTGAIKSTSKTVEQTTTKATEQVSKSSTAMATIVSRAASKAFDVVGGGVKNFASGILEVGTSFESTMAKVSAISGASEEEFDALSNKARELGANTKYSSSEVAEGFTYMAMAGWETEDMLSGIDGLLNLATASGSDLASTSDIVTDALTAFGLSAADTGRFADVLAAASSSAICSSRKGAM